MDAAEARKNRSRDPHGTTCLVERNKHNGD